MNSFVLYLLCLALACAVTAGSLPVVRRLLAPRFMDAPGGLKHHARPTPVLGGISVMLGIAAALVCIRLITSFPTGTLHALRGILWGAGIVFITGVADDMHKPEGVKSWVKLVAQGAAAVILMAYGVHIQVFDCPWLDYPLSFFWVIGITNAFNLLDISDGLCTSQAAVSALGLAWIALPGEAVYVNFAALALLGACIGFWPYNHAKRLKTFLGDSGSMLLGFLLAALCMGTGYSQHTNLGFLAPFFILAVPLFDTLFVMLARALKGKNPLAGSPDHIVQRLKRAFHFSTRTVLTLYILWALFNNLLAFALTRWNAYCALALMIFSAVYMAAACLFLLHTGNPAHEN